MVKKENKKYYTTARDNGKAYCYNSFVDNLMEHNKLYLRVAVIQCIISILLSISCITYNCTIRRLRNENEAKNAQIKDLIKEKEVLIEQKNGFENELRYYIDLEQGSIDIHEEEEKYESND